MRDTADTRGLEALEKLVFSQKYSEQFLALGTPLELRKHQVLCSAGDIPDSCYYVRSGKLVSFEYTEAGSEQVFNTIGPGELILLPSMIATHRLTLNFKAAAMTSLVKIRRDDLFDALARDPEIAVQMVQSLSIRLISTIEFARDRDSHSVPWRVCKLLLDAAVRSGTPYEGVTLIQEKLSQQGMANDLHVNRVTVARAIRDLRNADLVLYINGFYCIRSAEKLRRHMDRI